MKNYRIKTIAALVTLTLGYAAVGVVGLKPKPAVAARVNAVCNNSGTDAATIQSAINGSAVSDEIVIDGPCLITSTIELLGFRAYRGDSQSTTLTQGICRLSSRLIRG